MIAPLPTRCQTCGMVTAEQVCHLCKTERAAQPGPSPSIPEAPAVAAPTCLYERGRVCDCGGRLWCLEVA